MRRAQGPDGALSASKYAILGGFDGTSNVLAGKLLNVVVKGTHAHSYVMAYTSLSELSTADLVSATGEKVNFVDLVLQKRLQLGWESVGNVGELAAFISFAIAFPRGFLALVDTYDTLKSGLLNFLAVGAALHSLGYQPVGIRLDSGDLAYLSIESRKLFRRADDILGTDVFSKCTIFASNDINEDVS